MVYADNIPTWRQEGKKPVHHTSNLIIVRCCNNFYWERENFCCNSPQVNCAACPNYRGSSVKPNLHSLWTDFWNAEEARLEQLQDWTQPWKCKILLHWWEKVSSLEVMPYCKIYRQMSNTSWFCVPEMGDRLYSCTRKLFVHSPFQMHCSQLAALFIDISPCLKCMSKDTS